MRHAGQGQQVRINLARELPADWTPLVPQWLQEFRRMAPDMIRVIPGTGDNLQTIRNWPNSIYVISGIDAEPSDA